LRFIERLEEVIKMNQKLTSYPSRFLSSKSTNTDFLKNASMQVTAKTKPGKAKALNILLNLEE